ncbi:Peptidyl-tRNA hydrolase [Lacunisphaera limnophila]|uniref:Peptidyl-tRNA hydrolase n=1 Tax=Lacunisphaera limnophila TaxID=1838286 RepID=A0A1D8AZQ6_9BACT|nr:aminoacyl-tRNA hydrolase [Lacunisphaera limnophila]AOS46386.1 Peptidyl-tRNA hydrolase [Lacunisphaera limnophila]
MSVTLIAGLGNPGREYAATRHNLGFAVVDALAAAEGLKWKSDSRFESLTARWDVRPGVTRLLVKPQTFMNESGRALRALLDFHKVASDTLIVAYDDLNIDLGLVKVSVTGSAGGHNGVASLLEHLGGGFVRYRLGIGGPRPAGMDLKDYVLGKFTAEETTLIDQKTTTFVDGLRLLLTSTPAHAMNLLNRRDHHEPDQP